MYIRNCIQTLFREHTQIIPVSFTHPVHWINCKSNIYQKNDVAKIVCFNMNKLKIFPDMFLYCSVNRLSPTWL